MTKRVIIIVSVLFAIVGVIRFCVPSEDRVSKSIFSPADINKKVDSSQWFIPKRSKEQRGVAPALNVTVESYLLKVLMPFPNLVIDSLSPASYRSNEGTPMAAYRALFEAAEYLKNNISDKINIPTIIFIDEKDEFISYSSLQEMIERKHLSHWHIHMVRKDLDVEGKMSNHLIINQESVGENMWKQIKDILIKHFNTRI